MDIIVNIYQKASMVRTKTSKKKCKQYVDKYKQRDDICCIGCGEDRWQILEFHHVDQGSKVNTVCAIATLTAVIREIDKCIVLCANCHKMEHWKRKNNDC